MNDSPTIYNSSNMQTSNDPEIPIDIQRIMETRRNRQNAIARGDEPVDPAINTGLDNITDSNMRNDNDLNIVARNDMLSGINNNNNNFMSYFDEDYYLDNSRTSKKALSEGINMMNANGNINEELMDNRKISRSELLKKKSLDLETLIVDRITRDKIDDAMRVFKVLEKMHLKYDDDLVTDIYYRVLQSMPKKKTSSGKVYSYRQNKNNFKDVLNELNNTDNIKAFNEDNPCINSLGEMWEECDINICSDKCKKKIMEAKENANEEDCEKLVTGVKDDKKIKMKDDIKDVILQRLKYCKKISDLEKGNYDMISYTDKLDLKNKTIEEIRKMSRLANMHYNSCHNQASEFLSTDEKYKSILNVIKTIDFSKLSLERLQEIRNDLTLLPTCDMLKFEEHDKNRDQDVKDGIRVGKYIIPNKTDYYEQIKGKDKPFVYKDIATDKHYLYDSFSKTLTGFEYPMTENSLREQQNSNKRYDRELRNDNLGPADYSELYDIKFDDSMTPTPSPTITPTEQPSPSDLAPSPEETQEKVEENLNEILVSDNKKILFNLTLKGVIEYLFLFLIVAVILLVFSSLV